MALMTRLVAALALFLIPSCGDPFFALSQAEQRAFLDCRAEQRRARGDELYAMDHVGYARSDDRATWLAMNGCGATPAACPGGVTSDGDCCTMGCACGASCISCSDRCHQ